MNELYFLSFSLLLLTICTAVLALKPDLVAATIVIMMVVISLLGESQLRMVGIVSNTGNILYAATLFMVAMTAQARGRAVASAHVRKVLFALGFMQVLFAFYRFNPTELPAHLAAVTNQSARIVGASFMAFVLSTATMLELSVTWRTWWGLGGSLMVAQIIDSIVFFPLAFGGTGVAVTTYLTNGLLIKMAVTLLAYPFSEFLLQRKTTVENHPPAP